ncbi:PREDICTED: uncharacterized protein LOC108535996 [Rhinopithecus bieti]|uniref:uncharacterized protein LOC108535996 n=1 Tax=Rhinopithecus bieti TaxID=61621 RepID=UPI00083BFB6C|nr:PREDICTED: uncharacterized protein LOC108535996 [Rhinopithecus bieti]
MAPNAFSRKADPGRRKTPSLCAISCPLPHLRAFGISQTGPRNSERRRPPHKGTAGSAILARPPGPFIRGPGPGALATCNGPERVSERLKEAVLLSSRTAASGDPPRRPGPTGTERDGDRGSGPSETGRGGGNTGAESSGDSVRSLQDVHGTRPCAHRLLLSFQLSSGRPSPPASSLCSSPASALLFHPPGPSSPPSSPSTPNLASVFLQACTSTAEREKDPASSTGPPLNQGHNLKGPRHPTPNAYVPPSTLSSPWDTTRLSQLAFFFSFCVHGACVRKWTHSKCGFWMRLPPALPATRFPLPGEPPADREPVPSHPSVSLPLHLSASFPEAFISGTRCSRVLLYSACPNLNPAISAGNLVHCGRMSCRARSRAPVVVIATGVSLQLVEQGSTSVYMLPRICIHTVSWVFLSIIFLSATRLL